MKLSGPFVVGVTLQVTREHPEGIPAIIHDGDSVLCTFPGTDHKEAAQQVCAALNLIYPAPEMYSRSRC